MTRSVRDAAALLDAAAGPMPGDPVLRDAAPRALRGGRAGAPRRPLRVGFRSERAARHRRGAGGRGRGARDGAPPRAARPPGGGGASGGARRPGPRRRLRGRRRGERRARPRLPGARASGGRIEPGDVEPLTAALAERGPRHDARRSTSRTSRRSTRFGRRLAAWWEGGFDLLLTPTQAEPPPPPRLPDLDPRGAPARLRALGALRRLHAALQPLGTAGAVAAGRPHRERGPARSASSSSPATATRRLLLRVGGASSRRRVPGPSWPLGERTETSVRSAASRSPVGAPDQGKHRVTETEKPHGDPRGAGRGRLRPRQPRGRRPAAAPRAAHRRAARVRHRPRAPGDGRPRLPGPGGRPGSAGPRRPGPRRARGARDDLHGARHRGIAVFNWKVFRAGQTLGGALRRGARRVPRRAASSGRRRRRASWPRRQNRGAGLHGLEVLAGVSLAWAAIESASYAGKLRKRLALGLAIRCSPTGCTSGASRSSPPRS